MSDTMKEERIEAATEVGIYAAFIVAMVAVQLFALGVFVYAVCLPATAWACKLMIIMMWVMAFAQNMQKVFGKRCAEKKLLLVKE